MYDDDSAQGADFRPLLPCMLGTLIDFEQAGWSCELILQLCIPGGVQHPDYNAAGWCMTQHVYFGRPDWAASILDGLRRQPPAWYQEEGLMQSVFSWGGDRYVNEILGCLAPPGGQGTY